MRANSNYSQEYFTTAAFGAGRAPNPPKKPVGGPGCWHW